jgi:hypothetical protein
VNQDQTFAIVLILVITTIFATVRILKGPIGQALARRLAGTVPVAEPASDAEVTELRARVAELEERMDFTERVLLQQQERGQVSAGGEHS